MQSEQSVLMVPVGLQTATRAPVQLHAVPNGVGVAEAPTTVLQDVNLALETVMVAQLQLKVQPKALPPLQLPLLGVVGPSGTSQDQRLVLCHTAASYSTASETAT